MRTPELDAAVDEMARELLARGERVTFVARGASMRPALRPGDRVTVAPLRRAPRVGELVLVRAGASLGVVHRVLRRDVAGRVLTKGDALPVTDGWVEGSAVLGRVSDVSRGGRPVRIRRWSGLALSVLGGVARRLLHSQG